MPTPSESRSTVARPYLQHLLREGGVNKLPSFDQVIEQLLEVPVERLSLDRESGQPVIRYANEAELRGGLAQLARAYGWRVQEEVVVPGWGRIDLVLDDGSGSPVNLVELKLELYKASDVRRGFQQADGYGRWWAQTRSENAVPFLVAAKANAELVGPVADAYSTVAFRTAVQFMASLAQLGDHSRRLRRMHGLTAALATRLQVHEYAKREVETYLQLKAEAEGAAENADGRLMS